MSIHEACLLAIHIKAAGIARHAWSERTPEKHLAYNGADRPMILKVYTKNLGFDYTPSFEDLAADDWQVIQ